MSITISPYVVQLAQIASDSTGLDLDVVLSHWNAEEGIGSANWPSNNPAGIRPGNSAVDRLAVGVNGAGFDIFPTAAAGANGYATLINTDIDYPGIRAAIKTGSPTAELNAIIQSPWDAGHYGGDGNKLYASYSTVTGSNVPTPSGLINGTSPYPQADSSGNGGISNQVDYPPTNYSIAANSQRTGNVLYGRRYRVVVSDSSGIGLDVSDLHCTFNIQKVINMQPPFSTVVIYNLNPETEDVILEEGSHITIEAGYEGSQYGLIFDGDILEPIRDKPDNVTYRLTLNSLDSRRQLNQAFATFTVAKGQSVRSLLTNLASKATVPTTLGDISPKLSTAKLPRGKAVFGLTRDYIRQIAQANNATAYAENGKVHIIHATDLPAGEIIDLTPQSGLIGLPVQQDLGVSFQCLLNPAITINTMVHISSDLIQGQTFNIGQVVRPLDAQGIYRVIGVSYVGDTRGNDWYTECQTVSQQGGIPGMISAPSASPW